MANKTQSADQKLSIGFPDWVLRGPWRKRETIAEQQAWISALASNDLGKLATFLEEPEESTRETRPLPAVGTIYFIGPKDGPIKIGFASRLEYRLKDLRTLNAFPIEVWAQVQGPPGLEREYHRRFAAHRQHGEWFSPHPDILAEIERLQEQG